MRNNTIQFKDITAVVTTPWVDLSITLQDQASLQQCVLMNLSSRLSGHVSPPNWPLPAGLGDRCAWEGLGSVLNGVCSVALDGHLISTWLTCCLTLPEAHHGSLKTQGHFTPQACGFPVRKRNTC